MKYNSIFPLEGFTFQPVSPGAYIVNYASDNDRRLRRYWSSRIEDMTIIDATKNATSPKRKDVACLRSMVKSGTLHKY